MKAIKLNTGLKNVFLGICSTMILFLFVSCLSKKVFLTSSVVPAARGFVQIKKDNNRNYVIRVQIENLAEAGRLDPSKKTYVVWMETAQAQTKNIGQIKSSTSLLSKKLKASFETVTSDKPTKIFITAEDDGSTQYPGLLIISTNNF